MKRKFTTEYVLINGIKQFFLHYEIPNTEVVLYLHGGPGSASSNAAYLTDQDITTHTMVYYDQRGAGKTLVKNKTLKAGVSMPTMICDLRETIQYIKDKYKKDKVALIGHSWGSILGTEYVKQYPEDILCYIGVGQVVGFIEGEKAGFDKLLECVDKKNKKDMKKICALGDYPFNLLKNNSNKSITTVRSLQAKYGLGVNPKEIVKPFIKSPIFKLSDIFAIAVGLFVNKNLINSMKEYDTSYFTEYKVPMYYIAGENDWQVPSVVAQKYYQTIKAPNKGFYWMKEAGHFPSLDNPNEFNQIVAKILKVSRDYSSQMQQRFLLKLEGINF